MDVNYSNFTITGFVDGQLLGLLPLTGTGVNLSNLQLYAVQTVNAESVYFDNLSLSSTSAVPDSGATAGLLGIGLVAIGWMRRKAAA